MWILVFESVNDQHQGHAPGGVGHQLTVNKEKQVDTVNFLPSTYIERALAFNFAALGHCSSKDHRTNNFCCNTFKKISASCRTITHIVPNLQCEIKWVEEITQLIIRITYVAQSINKQKAGLSRPSILFHCFQIMSQVLYKYLLVVQTNHNEGASVQNGAWC